MGSNVSSLETSEMVQAMMGSANDASDSAGLDYLRNSSFKISAAGETVPPDFALQCPTESYQYPPLPTKSQDGEGVSIRLIRLLPGAWDSPVELELVTVPLEAGKIPYYETVSYVWGSINPNLAVTVSCEGSPMRIPRSAAIVLRRFRFSNHARLLWVDAICINQDNPLEKSRQVSKMDAIYRTASQVLVYLGEADDMLSDMAMDCISERKVAPSEGYSLQAAVQLFSKRPWFSRIWVLQEVALAEVTLVICGSKCVPWACFPEWWTRNTSLFEGKAEIPPVLSYGPSVMRRPTLLQQLHDTRHNKATLALDKIYALLGLLQPEDRVGVLVDYTQSTASLYISVAKSIIERTASLRILSGRIELSTSARQEGLPSWAPDWSVATSIASLGLANKHLEPYDAGGKPACGVNVHHLLQTNSPPTLECLGITFDTVKQVAVNSVHPGSSDPAAAAMDDRYQALIREWIVFAGLGLPGSRASFEDRMASYLINRFQSQYQSFQFKDDSTNLYTLVGECFVDGIMVGEALNHLQDQLKGMGHRCRTFSKSCSRSPLETFCIQ
ncbi:heterokaryon incompatibility protein-domain-containing protein [Triangularia setosa]|uniref:Heterokaryon incompatibility protein-domain-containing protein n=1 Tax=Triangularia setosa TaxID=2587417 RepID=A0AAN7AAR0_9PEZI|nr:heterokaryon incompatibility protein-domain-containing protein [Podospora setosa]